MGLHQSMFNKNNFGFPGFQPISIGGPLEV